MGKPTKEQIIRFWVSYGVAPKTYQHHSCMSHTTTEVVKYPPIDLNNLMLYATRNLVEINFMYSSNCVSVDIEDDDGRFYEGHVIVDSFEEAKRKTNLALFFALQKVSK